MMGARRNGRDTIGADAENADTTGPGVGGAASAWPSGDGAMAAHIRAHDWAATPLGPVAEWPSSLRIHVRTMLDADMPMGIAWGPSLVHLYNDAAARIMGAHAPSLGRPFHEAWPGLREQIGPLFERVLAGEAVHLRDAPYRLDETSPTACRWFDISHSPLRDDADRVAGVLVCAFEVTGEHLKGIARDEALSSAEAHLRVALDAAGMGTFEVWRDGDEAIVDAGTARLFDMPHDARRVPVTRFFESLHAEDAGRVGERIAAAWQGGGDYEAEFRLRADMDDANAEGTDRGDAERWVVARGRRVRHGDREAMFGVNYEVTGARLDRAERDAAFDLSVDLLAIASVRDGRWRRVNPSFARVLGWSEAEIMATPYAELMGPHEERTDDTACKKGVQGGAQQAIERRVRCRDGSHRWIAWTTCAFADGRLLACVGRDVTERRQADEVLRLAEQRWRSFTDNVTDVLWIADPHAERIDYVSPSFADVWGVPLDARPHTFGEWMPAVHPDDREMAGRAMPAALGGETVHQEYRIVRPDGAVRWIRDTGFPIPDGSGAVVRVGGVAQDITERREGEERRRLLLAELQHRVRNTLGVVRSIAKRTGESARDVDEFVNHFDGRLNAFARTQAMVSVDPEAGVSLDEIVSEELLVQSAGRDEGVTIDGPTVRLTPKAAELLGLAVHELATNAVKYGAFAHPDGRVTVRWDVTAAEIGRVLRIEWVETGVPIEAPPGREGFGTELLERTLGYELDGKVEWRFHADGLHCTIHVPANARIVTSVA